MLIIKGRIPEAVSYVRHAMNLVETRQHKTAYDVAGQAESYSTLGKVDEALANRESSATRKRPGTATSCWLGAGRINFKLNGTTSKVSMVATEAPRF